MLLPSLDAVFFLENSCACISSPITARSCSLAVTCQLRKAHYLPPGSLGVDWVLIYQSFDVEMISIPDLAHEFVFGWPLR